MSGWIRVLGISTLIVIAYLFFSAIIQPGFIPFEYAAYQIDGSLVFKNEIGEEVSYTLWEERNLDVLILAFLLFVTAASCTSILREGR